MKANSVWFRGHRCFKNEWAGFETIKPINIIIGRNNTGKSHLLDLAGALCERTLKGRDWHYRCRGTLDEETLKGVFHQGTGGGNLSGDHWLGHGQHFVGRKVTWEIDSQADPTTLSFGDSFDYKSPHGKESTDSRLAAIRKALKNFLTPFQVKHHDEPGSGGVTSPYLTIGRRLVRQSG